ncbi:ABC transporter permease [Nocardia sp. NPDC004568]|uniref:ABC transporter permease n=1 Tax=Nocardia sp. NPDC004568 TaxID=3154551 RepID=UPI0033A310F5
MTTTAAPATGFRRRPLAALAEAEYLQFRRNKTLVYLATVFPIGIPVALFFIGRRGDAASAELAVQTFEMLALVTLLFVQYYSVLSMVTTRRGEGVLKRLRTGEAADWQIQTAPAIPGALVTLGGTAVVAAVVYGVGAPAPVDPVAIVLALVGGIVLFSLLALATSTFTKNAEAAQITSLPVMTIAMLGLTSIRGVLPDRLAEAAGWTPFAAVSDLVSLGVAGKAVLADPVARDFPGTFAEMGRPFATLAIWTVLAFALTRRSFRWDDRG